MNTVLTFEQVRPFVEANLRAGQTPALMGPAGIGKSSLTEGLEKTFKTKVFTLPVNQLADRADLTGVRMTQSESGSWRQEAFPHSIIMEAIEYAREHDDENPILFLDEFNRASADITSSILSFQTLRRIGTIDFPDNLRMIVAGNDKGNVTALDEASISRFAVYHVRPDLDTFFKIATLNPFIRDVLTQYPEDLMAEEVIESDIAASDDDDDDDNESENMAQFEFLAEDNFTQVTRPRTISYVSEWLTQLGIDKTGSDTERQILSTLLTDMTEGGETNTLYAGIVAHVGPTTFARHLYDAVNTHFNTLLSTTHLSNQPLLSALRPKQDVINALHHAKSVPDVETIIGNMDEAARMNTVVWLTESASVLEVDNMQSVTAFMSNAPHHFKAFDGVAIKNLMTVVPDSARVSKDAVNAMLASTATMMAQWKPMIQSVFDQG